MKSAAGRFTVLLVLAFAALPAGAAAAHDERTPVYPDGTGTVPAVPHRRPASCWSARTTRPASPSGSPASPAALKTRNETLYAAVPARRLPAHPGRGRTPSRLPGSAILVLPGLYLEEPSLAEPSRRVRGIDGAARRQRALPGALVRAAGRLPAQPEPGRGPRQGGPADRGHRRRPARRGRRRAVPASSTRSGPTARDGFYLRNLTDAADDVQRRLHHGDRRVRHRQRDRPVERRVRLPHVRRRPRALHRLRGVRQRGLRRLPGRGLGHQHATGATTSTGTPSRSGAATRHHNTLGYSGTAGDSVWAHDNRFTENTTGVATDSAFPDHPGMPQNHAQFERNVIADNNAGLLPATSGTARARNPTPSAGTSRAWSARPSACRWAPA